MKVLRSGPGYVGGDDSQDTMCNLGDSGRKGYGQEASTAPDGKNLGKEWEWYGVRDAVVVTEEGGVLTHVEIECSLRSGPSRYVCRSRA